MSKKKSLEDIFNDDEFGILDSKPKSSNIKSEDERLIESFQEINSFFEKNNREPEGNNVSEFKLLSRLKALRNDANKIEILKPHDRYNLLNTKEEVKSVTDILNDDDLGLTLGRLGDRLCDNGRLIIRAVIMPNARQSLFWWLEVLKNKIRRAPAYYRSFDEISTILAQADFRVEHTEPSGTKRDLFWFVLSRRSRNQ